MTHLKPIKLKTLHHPEYHLTEQLKLHIQTEDFNAQKACLNKYFPKYYRNLTIEVPKKDWSFVTKLRQTKVIGHFTDCIEREKSEPNYAKTICELEQRIFRNKRKSVKSLPLFFSPSEKKDWYTLAAISPRRFQFSTFFPRIKSLDLSLIENLEQEEMKPIFASRELEQKIMRSYGYFWNSLRCLEHLEMSTKNENFWFMSQEVNSSSRFLSFLKTFKLSLVFPRAPKYNSCVRESLEQLAKKKDLLNHVTHLDCKKCERMYKFDEVMGSILAQCSKLVSLDILIGKENLYYADVPGIFPEHEGTQVFQQLAKMSNLHTLNVSAFGTKSFVQHFSVPPSVRKLILYVGKSLRDTSWLDSFLDSQYNFFERWKGLSNLQILKLKIRVTQNPNDLLHKFVNPLLEALQDSCLKKLRLKVKDQARDAFYDEEGILDFSQLPEKISALKQLESLKILAHKKRITLDPKKWQFPSGLKKFAIDGLFPEEFDPKSFLQSLLPSTAAKDKSQRSLKLSKLSFESIETFDEFLKLAKKGVRSGNLSLDLKIALFVEKDFHQLFNYFKQPINLGENCTVDLKIWWTPPALRVETKKELSERDKSAFERIFGSFKLKVVQRGTSCCLNETLLEL